MSTLDPHTALRIGWLRDPETLNALLDAFQSDGMPMGSDRWAEYCRSRLQELIEKERTLRRIIGAVEGNEVEEIPRFIKNCVSELYRKQRQALTKDHQERSAKREAEAFAAHEADKPTTQPPASESEEERG